MRKIEHPWFSFAEVRNTDLGVLMASQPVRQHPALQVNQVEIPNKQGRVFFSKQSYGVITVKQDIVVPDSRKIPDVLKWLSGRGKLIFWDSPQYAYDATIINAMTRTPVSQRLDGCKISVVFTCQPFRMAVREQEIAFTDGSGKTFVGQGDYYAEPILKVEGTGNGDITINDVTIDVTPVSGTPLYLDCDAGIAYTIDSDGNMKFAGTQVIIDADWFSLNPKPLNGIAKNTISWTGDITKVTVYPCWRWF